MDNIIITTAHELLQSGKTYHTFTQFWLEVAYVARSRGWEKPSGTKQLLGYEVVARTIKKRQDLFQLIKERLIPRTSWEARLDCMRYLHEKVKSGEFRLGGPLTAEQVVQTCINTGVRPSTARGIWKEMSSQHSDPQQTEHTSDFTNLTSLAYNLADLITAQQVEINQLRQEKIRLEEEIARLKRSLMEREKILNSLTGVFQEILTKTTASLQTISNNNGSSIVQ